MTALHIAAKELKSAFTTPIGWLVTAAFLFLNGVFLAMWVLWYADTELQFSGAYSTSLSLAENLFAPFFGNVAVILIFTCPAISMRAFADERKNRTLELLLTSPVSTAGIVLGKFLGAMGIVAVLLAGTLVGPVWAWFTSTPDLAVVATAYLGLFLLAGAVLSMGLLFSAMTESQIIAWFLTMACAIVLYVMGTVGGPGSVSEHFALLAHLDDLLVGGIGLSDLAYFAGLIGFFLFAAHQRVEAFRWS